MTVSTSTPRYGADHYPSTELYFGHSRDGVLWVLVRPDKEPEIVNDVKALLRDLPMSGERIARVVDLNCHSTKLLLELEQQQQQGFIDKLQVCSPLCVPPIIKDGLTEDLLWQLSCWIPLKSNLGGWHPFDRNDSIVRQIALEIDDQRVEALFDQHPISAPLTFLSTLNKVSCARLMGVIRDPRWFVDYDDTRSISKITKFLGLMPRTQRGVSGRSKPIYNHDRCALVLSAWAGAGIPDEWDSLAGAHFWRLWDKFGRGWKADLKTSKSFVRFIKDLWMYVIYCDNQETNAPSNFFSDPLVSAAFREHCALLSSPLLSV